MRTKFLVSLSVLLFVYVLTARASEHQDSQADIPMIKSVDDAEPTATIGLEVDQMQPSDLPPIRFPANSKIVVDTAATEIGELLATQIQSSLGWSFEVIDDIPSNGHYIHLRLGCDEIPRDGFTHSSETDRSITLCASGIEGLKFAVFDFAERQLGVRWLFPAPADLGTYRPAKDSLTVSRENRTHTPAYINRRFSRGRVDQHYAVWADRLRMSTSKSAFHHNLYNLFPPSQYRLTRPEFYPEHANGKRFPEEQYVGACKKEKSLCKEENHRWQPVLTAKGITEVAVDNIRSYLNEHPNTDWYSLGMNDSLLWGEEAQQDRPLNTLGYVHLSDYFFPWVNKVVVKVAETHPRARFGLLAYHNLVDPPADSLDDRIVPYITYDRMQWADPARQQADRSRTQTWSNRTHELGWYDYVYGDQKFGDGPGSFYAAPRVYPHLMAEYLRFGRDHGVRHYYAEAYPSSELWSEGPKLYVLAKLLWDPDLDVDALLTDWYQAAVGEGAMYLSNYYSHWESFWTERVPLTQWFKSSRGDYLSFRTNGYLIALTSEDQEYLRKQMDGLKDSTRGTEFEERADFFLNAWDEVNNRAFGARFELEKGNVPDGYSPVFEDSIEGTLGKLPADWRFWNRPDVGSKAEPGLTADHASDGNNTFAIHLEASGKKEAYAVIYRSAAVSSHTKYCLKARVRSADIAHTLSLSFKRNGEKTQTHKREQIFPIKDGWQTTALCTEVPANDDWVEVTVWVGVKSRDFGEFDAWFDDVSLYSKP